MTIGTAKDILQKFDVKLEIKGGCVKAKVYGDVVFDAVEMHIYKAIKTLLPEAERIFIEKAKKEE